MECRRLEITLSSAKDLKDVNLFTKMDVYAAASVKGDPHYSSQKQKTHVDKDSGSNPRWDHTVKFTVDEDSLQKNRLSLKVELFSDRSLGDREIGELHVPLKELLDLKDPSAPVSYAVRTPSGKPRGTLTFSFKFSDKISAPAKDKIKAAGEPPLAYPAVAPSTSAYGGYAAPPPPAQAYPYPYPAQQPAYGGYPPHQPAYGGYPQQQPAYGYPPQQPGYGYPPQQPGYYGQPPKKSNNGGKMAMGIGAGLLGGLLIGDMVSDVGDMNAYDAGFDDGFGF